MCYVVIQDGNSTDYCRQALPLSFEDVDDFQVCSCHVACTVMFCNKAERKDLALLINHFGDH